MVKARIPHTESTSINMKTSGTQDNPADTRIAAPAFSEIIKTADEGQKMALLALGHTKIEQRLYETMLAETRKALTRIGVFSIHHLMKKTGLTSDSSIRRGCAGLIKKLSIEKQKVAGDGLLQKTAYVVYSPEEIFIRREEAGIGAYAKELFDEESDIPGSWEIIEKIADKHSLSRREAQVALRCAEGLTNAEIGEKLFINEETVKFHMRNILIKFGVKRRTELMAQLFRHERSGI